MKCSLFSLLEKCWTGIVVCRCIHEAGMSLHPVTGRDACPTTVTSRNAWPAPSFLKSPDIRSQRIDLMFREFLSIRRHLALAIHDRIEQPFVAYPTLPLGIGQISSMFQLAFEGFCPTIFSMTTGTVPVIQFSSTSDGDVAKSVRLAAERTADEHAADRHNKEDR